jgi:hypothetical protein
MAADLPSNRRDDKRSWRRGVGDPRLLHRSASAGGFAVRRFVVEIARNLSNNVTRSCFFGPSLFETAGSRSRILTIVVEETHMSRLNPIRLSNALAVACAAFSIGCAPAVAFEYHDSSSYYHGNYNSNNSGDQNANTQDVSTQSSDSSAGQRHGGHDPYYNRRTGNTCSIEHVAELNSNSTCGALP